MYTFRLKIVRFALVAQLERRQTEDLEVPRSIRGEDIFFFLVTMGL